MIDRATSDDELLAAWAEGNLDAGTELVERHLAAVHRFFRNKVGVELEDLVQQTFLACVEARARYQQRSRFVTFLLGIARNQLFTYYKTRTRAPLDVTVSAVRDLGTSPTGMLAKRDDERLIAAALQHISLDAQVILELVYWEGLDGAAIADVLDVPLNTVYTRLRRAKLALRQRLRELAPDRAEYETAWQAFDHAAPSVPAEHY